MLGWVSALKTASWSLTPFSLVECFIPCRLPLTVVELFCLLHHFIQLSIFCVRSLMLVTFSLRKLICQEKLSLGNRHNGGIVAVLHWWFLHIANQPIITNLSIVSFNLLLHWLNMPTAQSFYKVHRQHLTWERVLPKWHPSITYCLISCRATTKTRSSSTSRTEINAKTSGRSAWNTTPSSGAPDPLTGPRTGKGRGFSAGAPLFGELWRRWRRVYAV